MDEAARGQDNRQGGNMTYAENQIDRQFDNANANLERGATELDLGTTEGFVEWNLLLREFQFAGSAQQSMIKSEHSIMSGAINAIK
jgi:hypothetical protein